MPFNCYLNKHILRLVSNMINAIQYSSINVQNGNVVYFLLEDWSEVECYKHTNSIKQVHMNDCGSHVAFIDLNNEGFVTYC